MTDTFEEAIGLEGAGNDWEAVVPEGWDFMGIANGGLISSMMVTTLAAAVGRPDPITSTAHFLRPAFPGPVAIATALIREGRRLTTARAELSQNGKLIAHLVASLGDLSTVTADPIIRIQLPDLPPPEECIGPDEGTSAFEPPPIAHRLNLHLNPADVGFLRGEHGEPKISGWAYVPFGTPTTMMPVICDALPPPFFNTGFLGPLPTVELTVHTYRRPSPGPVAALFRTDHAGPRYLEEDGWIRDSAGQLLAVSRQIAVIPT